MKNSDMPAMPTETICEDLYVNGILQPVFFDPYGLTKREHFAGLAMQGLLVNCGRRGSKFDGVNKEAVVQADALLAELERTA